MFRGKPGTLPDGTPSGMLKAPVTGPVTLSVTGFAGDAQADRRVHGGADKAIHHLPAEHYAALMAEFPAIRALARPGTLGENLSTEGLNENDVRIGDIFALGGVRLQLTQPRRPCWKIDLRLEQPGVAAAVRRSGRTGWYLRVLEPGTVTPACRLQLLESSADAPTVAEFHALSITPRPPLARLRALLEVALIPAGLRAGLRRRLEWLQRNGPERRG